MGIHGVFIGIDTYHDPRIGRLRCAANDARDMGDMFGSIGAQVSILLNSRATAIGIRRAVASMARSVNREDTAVLFFSGHGAVETHDLRSSGQQSIPFLLPSDAVPGDFLATALPMEEFGRFLNMIPCKNVLFFFDSCYSGSATHGRSFALAGSRGPQKGANVLPRIAGEGTVVLAASGEYELAYEDPTTGHGVFTEYLLEALSGRAPALRGDTVALGSVYEYVSAAVPKKTERLFEGYRQRPLKDGQEREPVTFPVMRQCSEVTLANFPYDFLPLTVVIGDRREEAPRTAGDVFALSASPAELRWLLKLGLPAETEIISDKVFMMANKDVLRHYGTQNLLAIGSPAANLVSRQANDSAFFPFAVDSGTRDQWVRVTEQVSKIGNDRTKLTNYGVQLRTGEPYRYYMNQYRRGGLVDPTYSCAMRGERIPDDGDYGVVTLCRNPYSQPPEVSAVCIVAAGVHLPGTMHAVGLLSQAKDHFHNRPLGGVFSVLLSEPEWVKRITSGHVTWSTEPYDHVQMREALTSLVSVDRYSYVSKCLSPEEIEERIRFLNDLCQWRPCS